MYPAVHSRFSIMEFLYLIVSAWAMLWLVEASLKLVSNHPQLKRKRLELELRENTRRMKELSRRNQRITDELYGETPELVPYENNDTNNYT